MDYCNGFMICPTTHEMLCVRKNRPAFQAGKWNGIGGKLEENELPIEAMVREFREETTIVTTEAQWERTILLSGPDFSVHFFRTFVDAFPAFESPTDEMIWQMPIDTLLAPAAPVLANMKWILPLQLSEKVRFPLFVEWA
jgi:8-oxo-dGTP diphosphatase